MIVAVYAEHTRAQSVAQDTVIVQLHGGGFTLRTWWSWEQTVRVDSVEYQLRWRPRVSDLEIGK